jgi:hypothetical protein
MKRMQILRVAVLWLLTLDFCFAADRSYWEGTEMALRGWRLPSPAAHGPFWGGDNGVVAGRMFETREQLLFAINVWMKKYHQPLLTMNDLIVRVANRESIRDPDPQIEDVLECIINNSRFRVPIDLWMEPSDEIILSAQRSSKKRLSLPLHFTLTIRILSLPWGSEDSMGNTLKITYQQIPIAYTFPEEERKNKTRQTR